MNITPTLWLQDFEKCIQNTKARVDGINTSFENASLIAQNLILTAGKGKKTVWWVANGGSATIGSHLSQDLINKLTVN